MRQRNPACTHGLALTLVFFIWTGLPIISMGSSKEGSELYYFPRSTLAEVMIRSADGRLEPTQRRIYFQKGEFIRVAQTEPDGSLLVKVQNGEGIEYAVINEDSTYVDKGAKNQSPQKSNRDSEAAQEENIPLAVKVGTNKPGFLKRMMGATPKQEPIVFYDGPGGKRVTLLAEPNPQLKCQVPEGQKSPCTAFPTSSDELKIVDTTIRYVPEPGTGELKPRSFYKVQTTYCPSGPKNQCPESLETDRMGWIEASRTRSTPVAYKHGSELIVDINSRPQSVKDKTPAPCPDPTTKMGTDLKNAALSAQTNFDNQYTQKLGACLLEGKGRTQSQQTLKALRKKYFESGVNRVAQDVLENGRGPSSTPTPSAEQLFEIDMLARTLYGEMRNCSHQSDDYYRAVTRVIFNRVAIVKQKGYIGPFVNPSSSHAKKNPPEHVILADVISQPEQISSWEADDPNIAINLCPGKEKAKDGSPWQNAVRAAWDAVMNRKSFLEETSAITHAHYTSNMTPSWAKKKQKQGELIKVENFVGKKGCLILWRDGYNKMVKNISKN